FHVYFLLFLLFFSYYSLPLLYLLSFPTRRSSDLGLAAGRNTFSRLACRPMEPPADLSSKINDDSLRGLLYDCFECGPGSSHKVKDRKSTRLNSSHGSISYAVFCLKKKKKTNTTET